MKQFTTFFMLTLILLSCNNIRNLKKEDICGKRFSDKIESSIVSNTYLGTGTVFNCDGTFESGATTHMEGQNSVDRAHFTGTWEIIKEIPDNVTQAVKKFGVEHDNYAIIKYSSSNGVSGYCLYYKVETSITFEPLYMGQISMYAQENEIGALGILGGFLE